MSVKDEEIILEWTEDEENGEKTSDCGRMDVVNLIKIIKTHPELYTQSNLRYSDHEHKNGIWDNIANEIGTSAINCKKKWNGLRDGYVKYLKKLSTGDKPKYRHAQRLSFLSEEGNSCHIYSTNPNPEVLVVPRKGCASNESFLRSHEATKLLIELVKSNPCLYDKSCADYMNYKNKVLAWKSIGKQLNCKIALCKTRWANIRDIFKKSLGRVKNADSTGYLYSEQLSFLKPCFGQTTNPKGIKNRRKDMYEVEENTSDTEMLDDLLSEKINDIPLEMIKQETGEYFTITNTDHLTALPEHIDTNIDSSINAFLKSLAPTLKLLRPYYLNRAKTEIFAIVQKYELEMLLEKEQH